MEDNQEIRNEAWRLLWQRHWFWKLLGAAFLLQLCRQAVMMLINQIFFYMGVFSFASVRYLNRTHQQMPEFTPHLAWELAISSLIVVFFAFILSGIAAFGNSRVLLNAADDEPGDGWLKSAFGGFKMPLSLAWLSVRLTLVYFGWMLLAVIPGIAIVAYLRVEIPFSPTPGVFAVYTFAAMLAFSVFLAVWSIPFYKYRYLFRIKADNPDWSAGECMRRCRELTNGNKWRIFIHDCSYWRAYLGVLLSLVLCFVPLMLMVLKACDTTSDPSTGSIAVYAVGIIFVVFAYFALLAFCLILGFYVGLGQTLLYRRLSRENQ